MYGCIILVISGMALYSEAQTSDQFQLPFSHYRLKNGLQVILAEDHSLPLVSVVLSYNVGSIHDEPGKAGLAYLMENLMFLGSANVGPMQHISIINKVGGIFNAHTTEDKTVFYQTVPSNQLAIILWLESDRMRFLDINASSVERAKEAVMDEVRHRRFAEPYLESFFVFDSLIYPDFAYSHPVIGRESHLRNITVEDVKKFYSTYYVPNNAVLTVCGRINVLKTKDLISRYFDTLPRGKDIAPFPPSLPTEKKEVVESYLESLAPSPAFHLGYKIGSPHSDDFYTLTVIDYILFKGKTSRLYRRLLKRERIVLHLSGGIEKRKDLATFKIFAVCSNDFLVDRSQRAISTEIERLKTTFVSERELRKVKTMLKMDYINRFATTLDKGLFLTDLALSQKMDSGLFLELDRHLKVTTSDIIGIVNRYFTRDNMILLNIKVR